MDKRQYIQTILPLKLEWEPWYYTTLNVTPGTRVKVNLAGREYIAVVSRIASSPDIDPMQVHPINGLAEGLEPITEEELRLWRFISEYYLCTAGEVYKAAYPAGKQQVEARKRKSAAPERDGGAALNGEFRFESGKPLLAAGPDRHSLIRQLISKTLRQGKDVILLRPDAPALSFAELRNLSQDVRRPDSAAQLIEGRRQILFLPYCKLGLIVVEQEQDAAYKQESPAPRFNARDVAIMLGSIHGAQVILGSDSPSLESLLNARSGKYETYKASAAYSLGSATIIDTSAEKRKRGMNGSYSLKLIGAMENALAHKDHILVLLPWADTSDAEIEARALFPQARTRMTFSPINKAGDLGKYGLVAILNADFLFSRQDFRSDERALQALCGVASRCTCPLIIQGADLPARLQGLSPEKLLEERRRFGYPPFTRLVEIKISDRNEARKAKMASLLCREFGQLQIFLPKDSSLAASKADIARRLAAFEKQYKYSGHVYADVDPL
ncbi:MAG: hypothetical protein IKS78_08355, partial [Clostridia bacterium]|nr:hypothetical protein [Clostridia bacterium]